MITHRIPCQPQPIDRDSIIDSRFKNTGWDTALSNRKDLPDAHMNTHNRNQRTLLFYLGIKLLYPVLNQNPCGVLETHN
jgi:hypothetical protein